jgi:hypothetical protein
VETTRATFYASVAGAHTPSWSIRWMQTLTAGVHYRWMAAPGMTGDANSPWSLTWWPA